MENLGIETLFGSVYKNKRVLITGHSGFKGSWLALWLSMLGARVAGFSLPPNTNPSHFSLLELEMESHFGDINYHKDLCRLMSEFNPEIVFHLAAQPLVLESYSDAHYTFQTNIQGTVNLLECCRKTRSIKCVIVITSDKVYENTETEHLYDENDRLGGLDPYSASKACVEIICNSYRKSFFNDSGILLATARAGNVIGGGDWAKYRLIPDVIRSVQSNESLSIRSPHATRPWQHVLEPLSGYLLLGQKLLNNEMEFAEAWNFGPDKEGNQSVEKMVSLMKAIWPVIRWHKDGEPHHHEATLLQLNSSKSRLKLEWKPVWTFQEGVSETAQWYKTFMETGEVISSMQIRNYILNARNAGLSWAG